MVRGMIKCFPRSTRVPKLLPAGRRHRQATLANAHRNGLVASSLTDGEESSEVPEVTISYRGRSVRIPRGTKLRTALLSNGLTPHNESAVYINCRGIGSCGTCAVEVLSSCDDMDKSATPAVLPVEWTTAERLRLNFPPHSAPSNQKLRLACQVRCNTDLTVVKRDKFWGEGDVVRDDFDHESPPQQVQPLGRLEFLLDPESDKLASQEASKSVKQDRASVLIQALVSALTEGLRFAGVGSDRSGKIASAERTPTPTTLNELKTRLVVDFENAYFVTGVLDDGLYDPECTFEDPTVKFSGVELWKRNLALLVPFLVAPNIELLSTTEVPLSESEDKNLPATSCMLRCQWKLTCGLKLPWKPYIELIGETDYTILDAVGGVSSSDTHPQIVYHLERWNISGLEALVQLVRPAGNQAIYNQ